MSKWPANPVIHEIFTWVWLADLAADAGRTVTLADVPAIVWDDVARPGVDAVWLMGVWERSPIGAAIARGNPGMRAAHLAALPDLTDDDVVGSAYCIRDYVVDQRLGGDNGLAEARRELANRGVRLILDLVPNHVAPDHPWVQSHPEYFVRGSLADLERDPDSFIRIDDQIFACGRDPYFPAWPEVLQLDASHPGLRAAMAELAVGLAQKCDGLRCDMAMLVIDEVFARTWTDRVDGFVPTRSGQDFWPPIIAAAKAVNPQFAFLAEAYWDLEPVLLAHGFDACYDKRLYDRIVHERSVAGVRDHLGADVVDQHRTVRFIENHDEPRAATLLGVDAHLAGLTAVLTLAGFALVHEGEADGRRVRVPVTLGRRPFETTDPELRARVDHLLAALSTGVRSGAWAIAPIDGWPDNNSAERLLAWTWTATDARHLIIVNLSDDGADGRVRLPWPDVDGTVVILADLISGERFERDGSLLCSDGLYVALDAAGVHVMHVT